MLIKGASIKSVVHQFNVHLNTISRMQAHFHHFGTCLRTPKKWRPIVTTFALDRYIHSLYLRNTFSNAALPSRIIPGVRHIPSQTIQSRLCEINLSAHRPAVRPETSLQTIEIAMGKAAYGLAKVGL